MGPSADADQGRIGAQNVVEEARLVGGGQGTRPIDVQRARRGVSQDFDSQTFFGEELTDGLRTR